MKLIRKKALTILSLMLAFYISSYAQDKSEKIDKLVSAYSEYGLFSGTVLVADESGVNFEKAYGFANIEWNVKNDIETKFRIGSITKQFTALLILQLVEKGKISLEGTISDYLPYYRKDIGAKVTIHQLLNHTSGIPSYTSKPNFFTEISKKYYNPKDFVIEHCSDDPTFEPGSEWSYNNSGYFILGAILEEITGKAYADLAQEKIFEPLNMNSTGFDSHKEIIKKRATGYTKTPSGYENSDWIDMSLPYAAGSLYSTVGDLCKWDRSLYTDKLLSAKSRELMMTPTLNEYGYGFVISSAPLANGDSVKIVAHGGGINGFSTMIFRLVESKELIVALSNAPAANLNLMCMEIVKILNDLEYVLPKKPITDFFIQYVKDEGSENLPDVFNEIKENASETYDISEGALNSLGYTFLQKGDTDAAIKIFEINIKEYPNSFNVYDSMGEAFMEAGDNERAIEYYNKSLELNPRNDNAVTMLGKLGVEVEPVKDVEVAKEILETYVGEYQLMPNFILLVSLKDNQLMSRATGQPEFPVFPESETKFYFKVVQATIEFNRNENGEVESLTLVQNGRTMVAEKLTE
ncbi:MAG: serine hydrolase [Melioribacteraceae bacterium]|nr:serine hydrolase [Melioribacteraceae bacterium]MCF8263648.1 serine hydrolase [Melioribacteraceae bacterium]MCF8431434.1 serine hydrolase [Melioribacteraceae bacterium]